MNRNFRLTRIYKIHALAAFLIGLTFLLTGLDTFGAENIFDCKFSTDGGAIFVSAVPHHPASAWVYLISHDGPVTVRIKTTKTTALGTTLPTYRQKKTTLVDGYTQFTMNPGEHVDMDFGRPLSEDRAYIVVAAPTIPHASTDGTLLPTNLGIRYVISRPGTYYLKGACTGNIDVTTPGPVYIIGQDQAYLAGVPDQSRTNDGIINGPESSEVHVRGVLVEIPPSGLFGMFLRGGHCSIQDCGLVSPDTRHGVRGRGGLECGANGLITDCVVSPGDDAIRLCQPHTLATDCTVHMLGNGAVLQFGWDKKFNGPHHDADRITAFGRIAFHNAQVDGESSQGRTVVGGEAPKSGSDISLTNLDLYLDSINALVNLAAGGQDVTVDRITISGTIHNPAMTLGEGKVTQAHPNGISAFTLLANFPGSHLHDVNISLGSELTALSGPVSRHVWISGDVTGTINGWTIVSPTTRKKQ